MRGARKFFAARQANAGPSPNRRTPAAKHRFFERKQDAAQLAITAAVAESHAIAEPRDVRLAELTDRVFAEGVRYLGSASHVQWIPDGNVAEPEVAFVGRSGCGMSSLLAALFKDARPTRHGSHAAMNFYDVGKTFRVVETPGYGGHHCTWSQVVQHLIVIRNLAHARPNLKMIYYCLDACPQEGVPFRDIDALKYLAKEVRCLTVVLTKADRGGLQGEHTQRVVSELLEHGLEHPVIATSATTLGGVDTLRFDMASNALHSLPTALLTPTQARRLGERLLTRDEWLALAPSRAAVASLTARLLPGATAAAADHGPAAPLLLQDGTSIATSSSSTEALGINVLAKTMRRAVAPHPLSERLAQWDARYMMDGGDAEAAAQGDRPAAAEAGDDGVDDDGAAGDVDWAALDEYDVDGPIRVEVRRGDDVDGSSTTMDTSPQTEALPSPPAAADGDPADPGAKTAEEALLNAALVDSVNSCGDSLTTPPHSSAQLLPGEVAALEARPIVPGAPLPKALRDPALVRRVAETSPLRNPLLYPANVLPTASVRRNVIAVLDDLDNPYLLQPRFATHRGDLLFHRPNRDTTFAGSYRRALRGKGLYLPESRFTRSRLALSSSASSSPSRFTVPNCIPEITDVDAVPMVQAFAHRGYDGYVTAAQRAAAASARAASLGLASTTAASVTALMAGGAGSRLPGAPVNPLLAAPGAATGDHALTAEVRRLENAQQHEPPGAKMQIASDPISATAVLAGSGDRHVAALGFGGSLADRLRRLEAAEEATSAGSSRWSSSSSSLLGAPPRLAPAGAAGSRISEGRRPRQQQQRRCAAAAAAVGAGGGQVLAAAIHHAPADGRNDAVAGAGATSSSANLGGMPLGNPFLVG